MSGTSWLLGGRYPWRSLDPASEQPGTTAGVVAGPSGLSLPAVASGAFGLESLDGSVGRLLLPVGVAVDEGQVVLLSGDGSLVYRWDPAQFRLVPLPEVGRWGLDPDGPHAALTEPRRFTSAANIATVAGLLFVADRVNLRVQVFDWRTLALVQVVGGIGTPIDLIAGAGGVYVLVEEGRRVYRMTPHRDGVTLVIQPEDDRKRYTRVLVDRDGRLYLLDLQAPAALDRFDTSGGVATAPDARFADTAAIRDRFDPPVIITSRGGLELPQRLADPCAWHARSPYVRRYRAGGAIYAIDTQARAVTVRLPDGRVRHHFAPADSAGRPVRADDERAWHPVDLVYVDGCAFILDQRWQSVYVHRAGVERLRLRFTAPSASTTAWRRIAVDEHGCLLLWDGIGPVDRVDEQGRVTERIAASRVSDRFTSEAPDAPPPAEFRITRDGAVLIGTSLRHSFELIHATNGVWTSTWLDSGIYNCQWHLAEIVMADLPAGSRVVVRTRTSNEPESDAAALVAIERAQTAGSWRETEVIAGPSQEGEPDLALRADMLVQSGPGQYLQLQVALSGSGFRTPVVQTIRLRFPRESLLQYLPAIYSKPDEQRALLDRLLAIADTTWSAIDEQAGSFERFLDPDSVPAEALPYLARWLDVDLEETWTAEEQRMLLREMPVLRARWGTLDGMRRLLRIHLARLAHRTPGELAEASIPQIVERFVERRAVILGDEPSTTIPTAHALWSRAIERRFQVGVYDVAGEIELVSSGDPDLDVFRRYAHAFRVFIPAAWVRTPEDEEMLRRAIDSQKPAHTTYELVLVEPTLRVGEQSTIGLDTVIGGPSPAVLACDNGSQARLERVLS